MTLHSFYELRYIVDLNSDGEGARQSNSFKY